MPSADQLNADIPFEPSTLTIEDATCVVRDGIILLDCVDMTYERLAEGQLKVEVEGGAFTISVALADQDPQVSLADQHGGTWGEHPDHCLSDWQSEVENFETRLGYWDWVESQIELAASDSE